MVQISNSVLHYTRLFARTNRDFCPLLIYAIMALIKILIVSSSNEGRKLRTFYLFALKKNKFKVLTETIRPRKTYFVYKKRK